MSDLLALAGPLAPYLVVLVGFLPSEVWRQLAVLVARRLDPESEVLAWVTAVATALLAGVVAKILVAPGGALAAVPALARIGAIAAALAAYRLAGRSVLAGVLVGEALLVGAAYAYRP
ncbi:MAG TPA: AzlD domain-containing protein [Beijerinckiaceae bacterium]|jgi:hypothetical protein